MLKLTVPVATTQIHMLKGLTCDQACHPKFKLIIRFFLCMTVYY